MTKNPVGVNGIDPVRQGTNPIHQSIIERAGSWVNRSGSGATDDRIFGKPIGILGELGESLANRANAIRPYGLLRYRSQPIGDD